MSTLRVDTIEANQAASVSIDNDTIVSGTLTATSTLTGQGNIVATGNVSAGSQLSGASLDLGSSGPITNAGTVNCTGVTATGTVSCNSLAVTGGAAVGSLTIGGNAYDQRVVAHAKITGAFQYATQVGTTNIPGYHYFNSQPSLTAVNLVGVSGVSWQSSPNRIRITLSPTLSSNYLVSINPHFDTYGYGCYPVYFQKVSNSTIDIFGVFSLVNVNQKPNRFDLVIHG